MNFTQGHKTYIMGIVNATPDSFFDGGAHADAEAAFRYAMKLSAEGADILDIGGESSRPGAVSVSAQEEIDRVAPVVERCLKENPGLFISIDTIKSSVAGVCLALGARMINDISGMTADEKMVSLCAQADCFCAVMHMRGTPQTMQADTVYNNCVHEVKEYLLKRTDDLQRAGVDCRKIIIDPGIGFGKNVEQNYECIAHISEFKNTGYPVLIGLSRKSLIGRILPDGEDRLPATIALNAVSAAAGADIIRVHDVKAHVSAMRAVDMLRKVPA